MLFNLIMLAVPVVFLCASAILAVKAFEHGKNRKKTVPSENTLTSEAATGTTLVPATQAASIKAMIFFLRSFNPIFFFSFII